MTPYLALWRISNEYHMVFVTSAPGRDDCVRVRMMMGTFDETVPVPVAELVGID